MNWGNKLILVFILFAIGIGFLVYKSYNTKYDLVSKDYYKEELRYQEKIDGTNNANKLTDIILGQDEKHITIQFPKELNKHQLQGEIYLYCPTNAANDKRIPINSNEEGIQLIAKTGLLKVPYHVKISWSSNSVNYYSDKIITVN